MLTNFTLVVNVLLISKMINKELKQDRLTAKTKNSEVFICESRSFRVKKVIIFFTMENFKNIKFLSLHMGR